MVGDVEQELKKDEISQGIDDISTVKELVLRAFEDMLTYYVPLTEFKIPEDVRILNLGCGVCREAEVLKDYFGNNGNFKMIGIDRWLNQIISAKERWINENEFFKNTVDSIPYEFIHGDATELTDLVQGEFDIIISRHPNIRQFPYNWSNIYTEAYSVTKPGGLFIATEYSVDEFMILKTAVERVGYITLVSGRNKFVLKKQKYFSDRQIIFAIK